MIEIERPKTAMETPAIVSAIPRNGFTEDPCRDFPDTVEDCLYDFQNLNLPIFSARNRHFQNVHETRIGELIHLLSSPAGGSHFGNGSKNWPYFLSMAQW